MTEPTEQTSEALPAIAPPPVEQRPLVHHGDVLATLYNELRVVFTRLPQLEAFERKVVQAAKSPAAWLALREELGK